ncbi:MAG TPA: DUF3618 domain-containing protein [Streptosporangiaceae bacterium]|nr:DUF3618 domain-containing protein [Streptosporangiaceae bacterium]
MTAQELEQDIEWTREHLGQTIDELAGQADVKARAARLSDRIRQSQALPRRWPLAVAAGVLIAGTVIIRRRRKRA